MIKKNPLLLFSFPVWLFKGKAHIKSQLSRRDILNAKLLPYHADFLECLRKESSQVRKIAKERKVIFKDG